MYDYTSFRTVFHNPSLSLDRKHVESTLKHRDELSTLFFDRIWTSIGLTHPQKHYPPKTNTELRNLFNTIVKAEVAEEPKCALLYYLLRDTRNEALAANFVRGTQLPEKYVYMVSGLWEMDHLNFNRAMGYLCDPSLTPTFADEIMFVLLSHPKSSAELAMGYYVSVHPPLKSGRTLDAYFAWLVEGSVLEAYRFTKTRPTEQKRLFEELVVSVLEEEEGERRGKRAVELIGLPLTLEEEGWFEDCLLKGRAAKCAGAKDSVLMRRLAMGKGMTGTPPSLGRLKGGKINGVNWEDIRKIMAS
jgi:hypothetical protein